MVAVISRRRGSPPRVMMLMGILGGIHKDGLTAAKGTSAAAKGPAEGFVAIFAEDIFPAISGNRFGLLVEVKNAPVQVMGDDAIFHIVQNPFQVFPVGQYVVDGQRAHFRSTFNLRTGIPVIEVAPAHDRAAVEKRA
jgi:hypothetical protein